MIEQVIKIAKEAGTLFRNQRDFEIQEKTDVANIVTSMDLKIQNMVLDKLQKLLPEASIYAEENDVRQMNDGYVWVVDPIDGTTNYAYDFKFSCISIALLYKKEEYLAVVYNPYLDEVFYAQKNKGAYLNSNRIHVSNNDCASSICTIGTSPYYKEYADETFKVMKNVFINTRDIRRTGSAALDLCYLACGRIDAFYERLLSPWDYAAGSLIIKEAGGTIETLSPYTWSFENTQPIVATNSINHDDFLEIIKK